MGDSMTKLSMKCNVQYLSFLGTKVQNLAGYIKPGLRRKPKNAIIHVQKLLKQIASSIRKYHLEIKVSLSSIIK